MKEVNPKQQAIKRALAILTEHFENVQIFCSGSDDEGTLDNWESGSGNILAILGHVEIWLQATQGGLVESKIESDNAAAEAEAEAEEEEEGGSTGTGDTDDGSDKGGTKPSPP